MKCPSCGHENHEGAEFPRDEDAAVTGARPEAQGDSGGVGAYQVPTGSESLRRYLLVNLN